ncbi:hypothetical protein [Clostridium tunisiense]|uniref:hypothetical protein n=1 Tax=Clostridium tunisiense TaxID=219748 RepID=UPI000309A64E|nr:hypothetical protein [Clostridium tunisiense]
MKAYKKSTLKYKGQIFVIIESEMKGKLPGIRGVKNGVVRILLNTNLPKRKKQLEFHGLLTGRGLRYIKNGRKVGKFA